MFSPLSYRAPGRRGPADPAGSKRPAFGEKPSDTTDSRNRQAGLPLASMIPLEDDETVLSQF
jgi:hypothetical protein